VGVEYQQYKSTGEDLYSCSRFSAMAVPREDGSNYEGKYGVAMKVEATSSTLDSPWKVSRVMSASSTFPTSVMTTSSRSLASLV
jgi:hypothetical protein